MKKLALLLLLSFVAPTLKALPPLKQLQDIENFQGLPLFSTLDLKKKQWQKADGELKEFKKTLATALTNYTQRANELNLVVDEVRQIQGKVTGETAALVNKKINLLTERRQQLTNIQELLKEIEDSREKQVKLLNEIVDFHQNFKKKDSRGIYSWQELRDTQMEVSASLSRIDAERKKKEDLLKQKSVELETVASLQKRIEMKGKEQRKTLVEQQARPALRSLHLQLENQLYEHEMLLLREKIECAQLKLQKFDIDLALKEEEVDYLENQLSAKKNLLVLMEKRLNLTSHDVQVAKAEANLEGHKALRTKEAFAKKIEAKKFEKEKLSIERNLLRGRLKAVESQSKPDYRVYHLLQSELNKIGNHIHLTEREIDTLNARSALAEIPAQNKELVAHEVEVRHKINHNSEDIIELLATFRNQRDIAINQLKKQKDKRDEVMVSFVENSRENDEIRVKQEKILARKSTLFQGSEELFEKILNNLAESKKYLAEGLALNQDFLSASAELLGKQEKIIGQYDLILEHLEARKAAMGLWKRSPRALSLKEVTRSALEGEQFIKQILVGLPTYLGPSKILELMRDTTLPALGWLGIWLLIFGIFYLLVLFGCRRGLGALERFQAERQADVNLLYVTIAREFLGFLQKYLGPLMALFFLYLQTALKPAFLLGFSPLITTPYYQALFYLASIPFLLYFASKLLLELKELNRKLQFLFFTERFQDRFILLITSFFYASAILLPVRLAVRTLFAQQHPVLPDVLLAAYSLVLIIVALLFFNKDDIVRLLPERHPVAKWFKGQIESHYYPAFFFVMSLFILSNQYVGYSNLAGYLAFAVPASLLALYGLFGAHFYIRKYAIFLFMKESEDEISDKFEHAKTYYGFFVIFSFLLLILAGAVLIGRIWGFNLTPQTLWKALSETLVVPIGIDRKLGFVQLISLVLFIVGGFLMSSLINRFILNRLFDILRTEPGTQNTVSKIFHYLIVSLSILLGFVSIHLEQLIWYVGTLMAVGLGFALKDILTDYVAGFFVLIERPIEIGNFIQIDNNPDMRGTVHKIDARSTTVMTRLNHSIIISNKDLITKTISNWGKGRFAVGFEVKITVDYQSNVDEVKRAITEVIQSNPVILRVPNIIVRLEDFEEHALSFLARAFISSRRVQEQWNIAAALREDIFKTFKERGIRFGFPQRVVHFADNGAASSSGPASPISFNFGAR